VKWREEQWSEVTWSAVQWSEVRWSEVTWSAVKWRDVNSFEVTWRNVKWREVQWSYVKYSEVKWRDVKSTEVKWRKVQWSDVKSIEVKWCEVTWSDVKWSAVKWSEVKMFGGIYVLSWTYRVLQFVCGALHGMSCRCSVICYVLINYFTFLFNFYILFSFVLCVPCFCIVSPHVCSCLFSICVQFYRPLPPSGNPFVVNKYII
jgi:hypothetical protein